MSKKLVLASATAGVLTLAHLAFQRQILNRFPDFDKKIAKKTYNKILLDSFTGRLPVDTSDVEAMDNYFVVQYLARKHSALL